MRKVLNNWKEELNKDLHRRHFKPVCEFCHVESLLSREEFDIQLYNPTEKETEVKVWDTEVHKFVKTYIRKDLVSADPDKDTFTFKCPQCGHICTYTREQMEDYICSYYGDNNIRFELDEVETNNAKEFINEHKHIGEFEKKGKKFFSTLGQQFTYEITPGGLGSSVIIKCNQCGKTKDITNTENW
jgi:Fe2+ or Zn2+ uptake regulation protein